MTDEEKQLAFEIAEKYHHNYVQFSKNATSMEFSILLKYIVDQANLKQRKIAGLD
ncbi:MAG: hypothetical protein LBT80_06775 [Lactobacillaceae bacterium]|jgi:hypothetical protein|nr:hypothetical protein [Lactobacillaceae bacterium]